MKHNVDTSLQALFDQSVRGVIQQGRQSGNEEGCYYRNPDGLKCAVGHVLPDEVYAPYMEGQSVVMLRSVMRWDSETINLLSALQGAHDLAWPEEFVKEFRREAEKIALDHGLDWRFGDS